MTAIHPAITLAAELYDRPGDLESHAQRLLTTVNGLREIDAEMKCLAARQWGDMSIEHVAVCNLQNRHTDQNLSIALGRYMEAEARRVQAMEEA